MNSEDTSEEVLSIPAAYGILDYSNLGFDVLPHVEALHAFAALGLDPRSVKPALRARDLVLVRLPPGRSRFYIGVTANALAFQQGLQKQRWRDRAYAEMIHSTEDEQEAEAVRAEVERYFLRHFPGRTLVGAQACLQETTARTTTAIAEASSVLAVPIYSVYVILPAASQSPSG